MSRVKYLKAYLAGHFDGEGNATFKLKRRTKLIRVPHIQMSHTHFETISIYKDMYGGSLYSGKRHGCKKIYHWQLRGCENIKKFVSDILPYSIEKRQQLEVLLSFCKLRDKINKKSHLTDNDIVLFDRIYESYLIARKND